MPAEVLAGLEHSAGELVITAPGPGEPWDRLEVVIAWGSEPRALALDLRRPCQRDLAWRLARQRELVVLAAGSAPGDPAEARLTATSAPSPGPCCTGRAGAAEGYAMVTSSER